MGSFLFSAFFCCTDNGVPPNHFMDNIDFNRDIQERSRVREGGAARLPGQSYFSELSPVFEVPHQELVVLEIGDPMVLLYPDDNIEFFIEVKQGDLENKIVESMWAGFSKPERDDPLSGVWFNAGTEVDLMDTANNHQMIAVDSEYIYGDLYLPVGGVQPYYHKDSPSNDADDTLREATSLVHIHPQAKLYEGPSGPIVGELKPDVNPTEWLWGTLLSSRPYKSQIEIEDNGMTIRAFVENSDLEEVFGGYGSGGTSCSMRFYGLCEPPDNLTKGTLLYDAEGGNIVGRITRDTWMPLYDEGLNWWRFQKETPWGEAVFFVRDEDRIPYTDEEPFSCMREMGYF